MGVGPKLHVWVPSNVALDVWWLENPEKRGSEQRHLGNLPQVRYWQGDHLYNTNLLLKGNNLHTMGPGTMIQTRHQSLLKLKNNGQTPQSGQYASKDCLASNSPSWFSDWILKGCLWPSITLMLSWVLYSTCLVSFFSVCKRHIYILNHQESHGF